MATKKHQKVNHFANALEEGRRGLAADISRALDIKPVNVARWKKTGVVPDKYCAMVEMLTGCPAELLNSGVTWRRVRKAGWSGGFPVAEIVGKVSR